MLIKEVVLHNFRQYKGTNSILFHTNDTKNIVIVSGKNGNGKTNFLMSLVWCLYGTRTQDVDDFFKNEIVKQGGYAKYIANSLNNLAKDEGESTFYVSITFNDLHISDLRCNEVKITRKFDVNKSNPESLEILLDGQVNELFREINTEHFIHDFLIPIEAAKFFFFDAEKIVSLAEKVKIEEQKELSKAYSEVLGIKKYEDLKESLVQLQDTFKQRSATPQDQQRLARFKGDVKAIEISIAEKEESIDNLKEQINAKRFDVNQLQERLIKESNAISLEEVRQLQERKSQIDTSLEEVKLSLKELLELAPFAINGDYLLQINDRVDKEFNLKKFEFQENEVNTKIKSIIAEVDQAKYEWQKTDKGVTIDAEIRNFYENQINVLIKKHFLQSENIVNNEIVDVIHDFTDFERREFSELLNTLKYSYKERFKSVTRDHNNLKFEGNKIAYKLRSAESNAEDPIIENYRKQKTLLETEIQHHEHQIETLTKEIGIEENKSTNLKGEIAKLNDKVEVAKQYKTKNTVTVRLIQEISNFIKQYKAEKTKSLEEKILKGLKTLMHTLDIKTVEVDMPMDNIDITLYNSRNEKIPKESLSKGQQQLYAMALLKALVEESGINFPVFIDSPLQKLDDKHIKNVISKFYPDISEQVVILPLLHREFQQKDLETLKDRIAQCYLIHKKGEVSQFVPVEDQKLFETYHQLYPND